MTTEPPAVDLESTNGDVAPPADGGQPAATPQDTLHPEDDGAAAAQDGPARGDGAAADAPDASARSDEAAATHPAAGQPRRAAGEAGSSPQPRRADGTPSRGRRGSGTRPTGQRGFPRAERPAPVPAPEHHHLPGWVRRAHARARGPLGDLLALLQGDERETLRRALDELTAGISSGRFSLAWKYPELVEQGRAAFERQRSAIAEAQRAGRQLENARRKASDRLRDAAAAMPADAAGRLHRALRAATDVEAVAAVEAEADRALSTARSSTAKRRDREIERTRERILRALPRSAAGSAGPAESWQDVLRRYAEEQQAAEG